MGKITGVVGSDSLSVLVTAIKRHPSKKECKRSIICGRNFEKLEASPCGKTPTSPTTAQKGPNQ